MQLYVWLLLFPLNMYHGFQFLCTSHNTQLKAGLQQLCIMIYFSMPGCFLLSNLLGLHCSIYLYHIVQLLPIPVWLFIPFFFLAWFAKLQAVPFLSNQVCYFQLTKAWSSHPLLAPDQVHLIRQQSSDFPGQPHSSKTTTVVYWAKGRNRSRNMSWIFLRKFTVNKCTKRAMIIDLPM